jgi:hypothetical protein
MAALCLAALTAACGGGGKSAAPAAEATYDEAVAPPPSAPASAEAGLGVKECDDYVARYRECISSKVPGPVRAAMTAALDQSQAHWRAAAPTPEGRAGLAQACARALDAARASLQAYGCGSSGPESARAPRAH